MIAPTNPHLLDCRAAASYLRIALKQAWPESVVFALAVWAFHWGRLALEAEGR
jgi:hypothetical protein